MRRLLPDLHSTNHQFWTVTVLAQKAVRAKVVQRATVYEGQHSVSYRAWTPVNTVSSCIQ